MSNGKDENEKNINMIQRKIIESITSLPQKILFRCESSPSCPFIDFDISEKLDGNISKKEKEYKIGNYLIKKTLGEGTFGKVKLGIYLPNEEKVAIKILEKGRIIEKDDEIRIKREFEMLSLFNHPNIILVAEIFESKDSFYSVMEYCEGGELFNYIIKKHRLSDEESSFYFYQLINGLEYIHSLGIVHRDLKPENLLLTKEHLLKIIDFGLSNYFENDLLSTPCGSPCYASPEMIAGKKYNGFKIDIWSSGIILYAMLCGFLPFEDKDNDILFEKIMECKIIFPDFISKEAKDLIEKILINDPDIRISIPEIKKHPFYLKGKTIFEQKFNVYQITKDMNNKISFIENIDINQILNKLNSKENNNKIDIENIEKKEKILEENLIKEIIHKQNQKEKKEEKKEKKDINNQKITEIKLNYLNKKKGESEIKKQNLKENTKQIIEKKENKGNESEINKITNYSFKKNDKNEIFEIEQGNISNNLKTEFDENINYLQKISIEKIKNENKTNIQINDNTKNTKLSKNNSLKNNVNEKKKYINFSNINKEISKINDRNVILIKNNQNIIRRKLIKNAHKLNLRINSRPFYSNNKLGKLVNYNYFKKKIQSKNVSPSLNNYKINEKNLIHKRINNIKVYKNKLNSKDKSNRKKLVNKGNLFDNTLNNIINNTADFIHLPEKMKNYLNSVKDIISLENNSKRTKSASKQNMKIKIYEISKTKNNKNNRNNFFDSNDSNNKNNPNYNKFINNAKYNRLHNKNLKNININFKKNNYKNNIFLIDENQKSVLKTETRKEKTKNLFKIQKMNLRNINTSKINNTNINIIKGGNDSKDKLKKINEKNLTKYYSIKTNNKKINIKTQEVSPEKLELDFMGRNKKYIIRTFDRVNNNNLKNNSNKFIKKTTNLNIDYKMNKKTIDVKNIRNNKINIDISNNIHSNKTTNNSKNNKITQKNTKKKKNKLEKLNTAGYKTNIFNKDILAINLEINNKKSNYIDMNSKSKKNCLNFKENIIKNTPNKKNFKNKIQNLNIEKNCNKDDKEQFTHIKLSSHNTLNIRNHLKTHKTIIFHNKDKNDLFANASKNSNQSSSNSNFNSFIKNPFMANEANNYDNMIQINSYNNYTPGTNNLNKKINYINNNKNSQILVDNKKKSFVTIRNTVINFNMIDSGLILASLNRKKEAKKKYIKVGTNSIGFHNNHLSGLCSKFNSSISVNKNNLTSNINNSNINTIPISKKTTLNVSSNNDLYFNNKKILNYTDNDNNIKKVSKINNKNYISNTDKIHMKNKSMKIEGYYGLKKSKKTNKNREINNQEISINNNKLNNKQFNTINNDNCLYLNEKKKYYYVKK